MAILEVYLLLAVVIVTVSIAVMPPLIEQARAFWTAIPDLARQRTDLADGAWPADPQALGRRGRATGGRGGGGSDAVSTVVGAISGFVGGVFGLLTILILAFYLLLDSRGLFANFVALFPKAERGRVEDASRRSRRRSARGSPGSWLLAAIIGTTAAFGLWLMDVPCISTCSR